MTRRDPPHAVVQAFARAFDVGELDTLTGLLAPEATAEVLGSPFPVEAGPTVIRETSLAYLLSEQQGPLSAEAVALGDRDYVLLRHADEAGTLDCALCVTVVHERITRIEYLVQAFRGPELRQLGATLGLPNPPADPA